MRQISDFDVRNWFSFRFHVTRIGSEHMMAAMLLVTCFESYGCTVQAIAGGTKSVVRMNERINK